jgi:hypothetical protein
MQITSSLSMLLVEMGYWVNPRSMTWFSRFLLIDFKEDRWLESFRMNKVMLCNIVDCVRLVLQKQNIKYR